MQTQLFDIEKNEEQGSAPGFKLSRLEVYNWGTFHNRICVVTPMEQNAFATGDVGSGKSTLVDALTTLLAPPRKIIYNKAAGAEVRERDLNTYVRGAYKTEQTEEQSRKGKVTFLRDRSFYTVILGVFFHRGLNETVSLAQVFRPGEGNVRPEKFYVVANKELSIKNDFSSPKGSIRELKKGLKNFSATQIFESFSQYATQFRRLLGIRSEQAIELFYQTVSMKSVGNLTYFVREHMLEKTPSNDYVQELCENFEDLNRLHHMVVTARQKVQLLTPLVENIDQETQLGNEEALLRQQRDALEAFFSKLKTGLLKTKEKNLLDKITLEEEKRSTVKANIEKLDRDKDELIGAIYKSGGGRLEAIKKEISQQEQEVKRRQKRAQDYKHSAEVLELCSPKDVRDFLNNGQAVDELKREYEKQRNELNNQYVELEIDFRKVLEKPLCASPRQRTKYFKRNLATGRHFKRRATRS